MASGIELIATERARQISEEGWSAEHDDMHVRGELSKAAEAYAFAAWAQIQCLDFGWMAHEAGSRWPWGINEMPEMKVDPIGYLVKAGALIAAEIDRLKREEPHV